MAEVVQDFYMPEKLAFFAEEKHRYKVAYGGRGGGKSRNIARALLARAAEESTRVLCAREIQDSIRESVHELLSSQIKAMGLTSKFRVTDTYIEGTRNDSYIFFSGLKHKIDGLKSAEEIDIAWVEEADTVSESTWRKFTPTIRKPGSEIWASFNPSLVSSPTYQRFVVKPPADCIAVKVGWQDNPWFTDALESERQDMLLRDPDAYENIWEGHPVEVKEGAVFGKQVRAARAEGRVTTVPVERSIPVSTVWDIGKRDATAIWFYQWVGFECRLVDYYEEHHATPEEYVQVLQSKGYVYESDWLPHDAKATRLGQPHSVAAQLRKLGRNVRDVPNIPKTDGIAMARTFFSRCWFSEDRCADGWNALCNYSYVYDEDRKVFSVEPLHDWASNGADAFRYLAIVAQDKGRLARPKRKAVSYPKSWMAM